MNHVQRVCIVRHFEDFFNITSYYKSLFHVLRIHIYHLKMFDSCGHIDDGSSLLSCTGRGVFQRRWGKNSVWEEWFSLVRGQNAQKYEIYLPKYVVHNKT